jgi:hypothetical protein
MELFNQYKDFFKKNDMDQEDAPEEDENKEYEKIFGRDDRCGWGGSLGDKVSGRYQNPLFPKEVKLCETTKPKTKRTDKPWGYNNSQEEGYTPDYDDYYSDADSDTLELVRKRYESIQTTFPHQLNYSYPHQYSTIPPQPPLLHPSSYQPQHVQFPHHYTQMSFVYPHYPVSTYPLHQRTTSAFNDSRSGKRTEKVFNGAHRKFNPEIKRSGGGVDTSSTGTVMWFKGANKKAEKKKKKNNNTTPKPKPKLRVRILCCFNTAPIRKGLEKRPVFYPEDICKVGLKLSDPQTGFSLTLDDGLNHQSVRVVFSIRGDKKIRKMFPLFKRKFKDVNCVAGFVVPHVEFNRVDQKRKKTFYHPLNLSVVCSTEDGNDRAYNTKKGFVKYSTEGIVK